MVRKSLLVGLFGLILWAALLCWAFISYPSLDNLVVGSPVYFLQGVDALGGLRHRPAKFVAILLLESAVVFGTFTGVSAAAIYVRLRFSLRTLLIATTLVAVVLGLIVWTAR